MAVHCFALQMDSGEILFMAFHYSKSAVRVSSKYNLRVVGA